MSNSKYNNNNNNNNNKIWRENIQAHAIFRAKIGKSNIRVKRWHNKYEVFTRLKDNFCINDFLIKSNRTALQTYKVEERTFGKRFTETPLLYT